MEYSVSIKELTQQRVLVARRCVRRAEIGVTMAAELLKVFLYAQQRGIAIAGHPITRYIETSGALVTVETGMRVQADSEEWNVGESQSDVSAETLPGGRAAVMIHCGPYEQLPAAYAALEAWIVAKGFQSNGAPWEEYLNDSADYPNSEDWKTEVCWPFKP